MIAAVLLFLSLGLDTLAVSAGLGVAGLPRNQWGRVGLAFALFEGAMPIAGIYVGHELTSIASKLTGYAAAGLLILVGVMALREALADEDESRALPNVQGSRLVITALSVSLDELAVGFVLGSMKLPIASAALYIGLQAFAFTFVGLSIGVKVGEKLEERAELASGIILTLLGIAFLVRSLAG